MMFMKKKAGKAAAQREKVTELQVQREMVKKNIRLLRTDMQSLIDQAAGAPLGSEGLFFLPYLTGERCPHPDPDARGAWIGLTAMHSRKDLLRALMEGVIYALCQLGDLVKCIIGARIIRSGSWIQTLTR